MAFQATSGSQREKWVAAFIPGMAILLITFMYVTFFGFPAERDAKRKLTAASSGALGVNELAELEFQATTLRNERTELQETIRLVNEEVKVKSAAFQELTPTGRHNALTALCREHGVAILKDEPVAKLRLPDLRQKSVETLQSLVSKNATGFRELTVAADYSTIVDLLKEIPQVPGVIPVSVKLEKANVNKVWIGSASTEVSWTIGLLM
ncbi:MAG: hypothetical protein AAF483_02045 [Planctomycetota bacterium]